MSNHFERMRSLKPDLYLKEATDKLCKALMQGKFSRPQHHETINEIEERKKMMYTQCEYIKMKYKV